MSWVGEFFAAIPQLLAELWEFGGGISGVAVTIGSVILIAAFLFGAKVTRDRHGWLSAILGTMGASIAAWWLFGIIPSAWIYFADGQRDLMENTVIPGTLGVGRYQVATNFYQVFRDMVVMGETTIAMVLFAVLALQIQKRFPRALAEGEEARPQSGGYK